VKIIKSELFDKWYKKLDITQKTTIDVRLTRILVHGNYGHFKKVDQVSELKFKSGVRIYYAHEGNQILLLLNGGGKNTKRGQSKDIQKAKQVLEEYKNGK
jgi:putative addiction module killer protein